MKDNSENNYWHSVGRKYRVDYDNHYMYLIQSFISRLERTLGEKLKSPYSTQPEQYYVDEEYTLYFTITVPITKQTTSEKWLDNMSNLDVYYGYDKQFFKLCPLMVKKNTKDSIGTLTLLYKEFDEV